MDEEFIDAMAQALWAPLPEFLKQSFTIDKAEEKVREWIVIANSIGYTITKVDG